MTEQLALPGSTALALAPELWAAYRRASARIRSPHAPNTERAYLAAWDAWARFCARHGFPERPPDVRHVVLYLEKMGEQLPPPAPNTVRLQLAALCALDAGDAVLTGVDRHALSSHPLLKRWLLNWGRDNPRAPRKQAPALSPSELERVLWHANKRGFNQSRTSHVARYARDRAILTLGIGGALRASDLVQLKLSDVAFVPQGLTVYVRQSKTDQHGQGHLRGIEPQTPRLLCAVDAVAQWVRVRGNEPGPMFCPLGRGAHWETSEPLSARQLMRLVAERCQAAGLDQVTSHSLRATFGTLTRDQPLSLVMKHANWKTAGVALRYQDRGQLFDDNPTRGLFDKR